LGRLGLNPSYWNRGKVRDFLALELLPRVRNENAGLGRFSIGENAWRGSENHSIVQFSIRLMLEELAGPDMDKYRWNHAVDQAKRWCREKSRLAMRKQASLSSISAI
jgi:hypothetical protein